MNSVHYVGMDVDKEKIVLARLGAGNAKAGAGARDRQHPQRGEEVLRRSAGRRGGARHL